MFRFEPRFSHPAHKEAPMLRRLLATLALAFATGMPAATASAQANAPMKVTLAGGSVGGAWSVAGNAIGETLRREYPNTSFTYEPGREQSNILLVSQGRVQLGIAHAQLAGRAIAGGEPFKQPVTNLRAIAVIDPQADPRRLEPARHDDGAGRRGIARRQWHAGEGYRSLGRQGALRRL